MRNRPARYRSGSGRGGQSRPPRSAPASRRRPALPPDPAGREAALRDLESRSAREGSTQLFIETPYRNDAMASSAACVLRGDTVFCAAVGLSTPDERVIRMEASAWKKAIPAIGKIPTVFLLAAAHADERIAPEASRNNASRNNASRNNASRNNASRNNASRNNASRSKASRSSAARAGAADGRAPRRDGGRNGSKAENARGQKPPKGSGQDGRNGLSGRGA